jgi:homoserine O-acetyltransferase
VRTPAYQERLNATSEAEIEYLKKVQDAGWKRMDANDWIWQSYAYDRHDVGQTQGFSGDTSAALKSIKARTLILAGTGDLLNPESDAKLSAKLIPGAKYLAINDRLPMGHLSGAGATTEENEFQNKAIKDFLLKLQEHAQEEPSLTPLDNLPTTLISLHQFKSNTLPLNQTQY